MRILKFRAFRSWNIDDEFVTFINENQIKREDILSVVYKTGGVYTLLYYADV